MPTTPAEPRALLADLYWAAVSAVAPGPALRATLEAESGPPGDRVHLLALGKAAGPMAEAAVTFLRRRGRSPAGGLLVVPEATASPDPSLPVLVGDHPIPGAGSLAASDRLAEAVRGIRTGDEVWVLLSGGASSLIAAPLPEIGQSDLVGLFHLLLGSGLDISAMNRVRKRFTRWGGGRLGVALSSAFVKNFTISDVINDDLASIGSGPCVADPTTAEELIEFLTQQEMWEPLSLPLRAHLLAAKAGQVPETPKPGDPALERIATKIIASNRLAVDAACRRAHQLGASPTIVNAALDGEAAVRGGEIAEQLRSNLASPPAMTQGSAMHNHSVFVWGGETTVTLPPGAGLGGRNQELALAAAEHLRDMEGPVLLSAGTDGRDGPTDAAGAFADGGTWRRIREAGRDPASDLARHNSHAALEAAGDLFRTGLTGTNVMDLVLGLVPRHR
jgi:hydroxypyruvate reductase